MSKSFDVAKIKQFIEKVAEECPFWVMADFDREHLIEKMQEIWDELNENRKK